MDHLAYEVEAAVEQGHWWFVCRRLLFRAMIKQILITTESSIIDLGTSTGTNLRLLREDGFANVVGLDFHDDAIAWCAQKGLGRVIKGNICNIPVPDDQYDFVMATDIIEHVEDDVAALSEIYRILKSGGYALVTVPAFKSLWGVQDDLSHHKRRYSRGELSEKIKLTEFKIEKEFYFNYLLFGPIWLARNIIRLFKLKIVSENKLNNPTLNALLTAVFWLDVKTAPKLRPPFGVSQLLVLKKPS
jgi:ubiquinone/menaquinone biosynthesis C-methylase UbiE